MGFINEEGIQHLSNRLVQGDAIKVASHRGHTVTNILDNITRECENVSTPNTLSLENKVNEFKVGEGRDVDVCGDVESGKIEVELQGQTYQNVLNEFVAEEVSKPYITINNGRITWDKPFITEKHISIKYHNALSEINKVYTLIFYIYENTLYRENKGDEYIVSRFNIVSYNSGLFNITNRTKGLIKIKLKQPPVSTHNGKPYLEVFYDTRGKLEISYPILLEGDYTQTPIEELPKYFQGIKSSFEDGIVDVEMIGKNLFDKNSKDIIKGKALAIHNGLYDDPLLFSSGLIKVTYNNCYSFTNLRWGWLVDKNGDKMADIDWSKMPVYRIPYGCEYIRVTGDIDKLDTIQIEQGSVASQYEDFNSEKLSFNIGEPLRSLPNGTCDEIRNNHGVWELVRKVGKVSVNSSIDIGILDEQEMENTAYCNVYHMFVNEFARKHNTPMISNITPYNPLWDVDIEGVNGDHETLSFRVIKSKLSEVSSKGFKDFLIPKNPIVYYQLADPIITQIEPIEFEVKPMANIYIKSGEVSPISNHTVVLNRAGQIEQGIIRIGELRTRVSELETVYESQLLENQLKLSLMNLDYTLAKEDDI